MKKLISKILILAMVLSLVPTMAFAANTDNVIIESPSSSETIYSGSSVTISGTTTFSDISIAIFSGSTPYLEWGVTAEEFRDGFTVSFPEGTEGSYTVVAGRNDDVATVSFDVEEEPRQTQRPTNRPNTGSGSGNNISFGNGGTSSIEGIIYGTRTDYAFGMSGVTDAQTVIQLVPDGNRSSLTANQLNEVSGKTAYQPVIQLNGVDRANNLNGVNPIRFVVPNVEVPNGMNPMKMVAFQVTADGAKIPFLKSRYDSNAKTLEFVGTSFGNCIIMDYNDINFNDLGSAEWATDYIYGLAARGVISGDGDYIFAPDRAVTRAEFTKMLMVAFDLYTPGDRTTTYSDVSADAWYCDVVAAASELGVVTGYDDGTFGGERTITRQEMVTMAKRAFDAIPRILPDDEGIALPVVTDTEFTDEWAIAEYAKASVDALSQAGILSGRPDGSFDPDAESTRAEAAKVVWSMFELTF